jgi:MFS family permease
VLTQVLSWHWIFFVNVPVGIVTLCAGYVLLVDNVGLGIRQGVDWVGSALVTLSVMVCIYAIITSSNVGWGSAQTLGLLGLAVALMVSFLVLESRISNPIMPLRILKLRTLTGSAVVRGLLIIGMFSTFFIGALYFEHVLGYSPVKTGLAFLPQALGMAGMSTGITAWLVGRFGNERIMYPGMVLAAGGLLLFASAGAHTAYFPRIFVAFLMMGIGAGASFMPLLQIGMSEIPNADAGLGSGVVNVSQQMAGAVGLAALGTIAASHSKSLEAAGHDVISALAGGYQLALLIAGCSVLLGLVLAPFLLRTKESPEERDAHIKENMANPESREHLVI